MKKWCFGAALPPGAGINQPCAGPLNQLNKEIQNSRRYLIAQMSILFQKTSNIGKILLTFAASLGLIRHSPNFPLKHVLDTCNWKNYAQDIS